MNRLFSLLLVPLAFLLPLSWAGNTLLIQELRERGVPVGEIPSRCLSELTLQHIHVARGCRKMTRSINVRLMLVGLITDTADQMALIYGKRPATRNDQQMPVVEARQRLLNTLNRYGVPSSAVRSS